MQDITVLLHEAKSGNSQAVDALVPHIYDVLRKMAHKQMQAERANHTLQPTALVHEAYLKLVQQDNQSFSNRLHFFSIAAKQMRRILIDHARAKHAAKRGGSQVQIDDLDWAEISLVDAEAEAGAGSIEIHQSSEKLSELS